MTALAQPSDLPPGVGNGQVYLGHAPGGWLQAGTVLPGAWARPGGFLQTEHIGVWKIEMRAAVD
jgi:hypothetical protein